MGNFELYFLGLRIYVVLCLSVAQLLNCDYCACKVPVLIIILCLPWRMRHKRVGVAIHLGKPIVVEGVHPEVVDVVVLIQILVIIVREWGIGVKIVQIRISSVTHVIRWGTPILIAIRETSKGTTPISKTEENMSQEVVLVAQGIQEVKVGVVASKPTEMQKWSM